MKITIYTIKDCAFSKQEKEYLNANKLAYEEKDLETDKGFLTEMLAISNNFAGTPVTRVEKDDGSIAVLKGFTKEEFDTTFGLAIAPTDSQIPAANDQTAPVTTNDTPITVNDTPITTAPAAEVPPAETISPSPVPTDLPPVEAPATPNPLQSVIDDLQSKSELTAPVAEQPAQPTTDTPPPVTPTVNTPTTPLVDAPTIPDFPVK